MNILDFYKMNNVLNEYSGFCFELNTELNQPTMATLSYFDGFALVRILANTKSRESILIRL